jgi:hypothetical protein
MRLNDPMTVWPIYIASRGRALTAKRPNIPVTMVVEPHESRDYRMAHPGTEVLTLPESDQGLGYVRQWIKDHATARGHSWFWMLDDDISGYYMIRDGKSIKTHPVDVLLAAQQQIDRPLVAHGAMEYQQFAWSAKKAYTLNSYCDVAVAIHAGMTRGIRFRPETNLKVDRDFTLQVLASGMLVVRSTLTAFSAPANGSNAGGLADEYAIRGRERQDVETMMKLWPNIVSMQIKKNGRTDAKINWRYFKAQAPVQA